MMIIILIIKVALRVGGGWNQRGGAEGWLVKGWLGGLANFSLNFYKYILGPPDHPLTNPGASSPLSEKPETPKDLRALSTI